MQEFFDRMLAKWEAAGFGLPRTPWDADADPRIYASPPDEDGYATWRPLEKTVRHDLGRIAPDLGRLHPSIDAYFNSWWFCALEGASGDYGLMLQPVVPGLELDDFLALARGYAESHGRLDHVPIGLETDGLQVVVANRTGEVALEDWERSTFEPLAPGLEALIQALEP